MTTGLARTRGGKPTRKSWVMQARASGYVAKRKTLHEYLEQAEVNTLIQVASSPQARLLMLAQWRAGLRISEALALEAEEEY